MNECPPEALSHGEVELMVGLPLQFADEGDDVAQGLARPSNHQQLS